MFAAYCQKPHSDDPMAGLVLGDRPEPKIPEGWVRVKVSHASLNRHDIFTLRGITSHAEGITYPMILGNDGAGTLNDGTPVVIYPVMGSDDWRGDETLDPHWHIFSEFVQGTFADYVAMPKRNAIRPSTMARIASLASSMGITAPISGLIPPSITRRIMLCISSSVPIIEPMTVIFSLTRRSNSRWDRSPW